MTKSRRVKNKRTLKKGKNKNKSIKKQRGGVWFGVGNELVLSKKEKIESAEKGDHFIETEMTNLKEVFPDITQFLNNVKFKKGTYSELEDELEKKIFEPLKNNKLAAVRTFKNHPFYPVIKLVLFKPNFLKMKETTEGKIRDMRETTEKDNRGRKTKRISKLTHKNNQEIEISTGDIENGKKYLEDPHSETMKYFVSVIIVIIKFDYFYRVVEMFAKMHKSQKSKYYTESVSIAKFMYNYHYSREFTRELKRYASGQSHTLIRFILASLVICNYNAGDALILFNDAIDKNAPNEELKIMAKTAVHTAVLSSVKFYSDKNLQIFTKKWSYYLEPRHTPVVSINNVTIQEKMFTDAYKALLNPDNANQVATTNSTPHANQVATTNSTQPANQEKINPDNANQEILNPDNYKDLPVYNTNGKLVSET